MKFLLVLSFKTCQAMKKEKESLEKKISQKGIAGQIEAICYNPSTEEARLKKKPVERPKQ